MAVHVMLVVVVVAVVTAVLHIKCIARNAWWTDKNT